MKVPKIIALCGQKEVGKDAVADIISQEFGHRKIAFADPLKDTLAGYISGYNKIPKDIDDETLGYINACKVFFKALTKGLGFADDSIELSYHASLYVREKPYSEAMRKALQRLGTEYFREKDQFWWVKAMHLEPELPYVITDCRFPNELSYVYAVGGYAIHIVKDAFIQSEDTHASESFSSEMECDDLLVNEMDGLGKLRDKVMFHMGRCNQRLYEKYGEPADGMCAWVEGRNA